MGNGRLRKLSITTNRILELNVLKDANRTQYFASAT